MTVTLADIEAVVDLVDQVAIRTTMEESRWLETLVGGPVLLKCENLQRTGSFKIRGAFVRLSRLTEEERARGVVAASAGNHAQGVALAAQILGIQARRGSSPAEPGPGTFVGR
jgi:threonine dehydratase